jgi:hypothetical protein
MLTALFHNVLELRECDTLLELLLRHGGHFIVK